MSLLTIIFNAPQLGIEFRLTPEGIALVVEAGAASVHHPVSNSSSLSSTFCSGRRRCKSSIDSSISWQDCDWNESRLVLYNLHSLSFALRHQLPIHLVYVEDERLICSVFVSRSMHIFHKNGVQLILLTRWLSQFDLFKGKCVV